MLDVTTRSDWVLFILVQKQLWRQCGLLLAYEYHYSSWAVPSVCKVKSEGERDIGSWLLQFSNDSLVSIQLKHIEINSSLKEMVSFADEVDS